MNNRKKLLVDDVQKVIVKRIICYWGAGLVFITLTLAFLRVLGSPSELFTTHVSEIWMNYWPVFFCSIALLTFAIFDILKFSNRFVGPVSRIRNELEAYEVNGELDEIRFRENDYWIEISEGINSLSNRIKDLQTEIENCEEKQES